MKRSTEKAIFDLLKAIGLAFSKLFDSRIHIPCDEQISYDEIIRRARSESNSTNVPMNEWVYILSNPSMPNLIKIGMTTRTIEKRVAELNRATSCPTPFVVERRFRAINALKMEQRLHAKYAHLRINSNREFFRMNAEDIDPN